MGRKLLGVTTLNGFAIDGFIALEEKHQKKSLKFLSRIVIMRYKDSYRKNTTYTW